ncbi:2802_t:CDS:2 [Paraglomus brasilianum]|uniref:2802_t:CDS:1 n=1 Tax=Paraglomus brasilianum TaxID=144538 RepID=A0A9N8VTT8_9GLOM|nr:2802_t:CDS:2 [Paraglomus brasilianum]
MLATVSLSNEWFGVLKATGDVAEDQSNAGYFQLIVLPQDVAKGIGEPGTSARTMPISYTADVKLVLPKPDTVDGLVNKIEKYGRTLANDESKFKNNMEQCKKIIEIFHHIPLRNRLLSTLHNLRQECPPGPSYSILSAWVRDIKDDSEDIEMGEYVSEEEETYVKEEPRESASSRVSLSALLNP